ncbi:MAG: hypothetical protein ABI977_35330 [Acidobacteriota bacterium]
MSTRTHAEPKSATEIFAPVATGRVANAGLLQRKCACGGAAGLKGQCDDCNKERLSPRRDTVNQPASSAVRPISIIENQGLHSPSQARFGHDFSQVRVHGAGAVRLQGDGPVEKGKTDPKQKPDNEKGEKDKGEKQTAKNTTPDGVDLGPRDKTKAFCLKPNSFDVKTSVYANTESGAQGAQVIKFEGLKSGTQDKKACSCDCGAYRHWISGFIQVIGPGQISMAQAELVEEMKKKGVPGSPTAQEVLSRAIAITPKLYDIQSCQKALKIQENAFTEEYTSCIGDNDTDSCKWRYGDGPGATSGLRDGIYIHVKHPFKYEIWDSCQGKSVATKQATIDIEGDKKPRKITWS